MSNLQEDYILRMIHMMGELILAALQLKEQGFPEYANTKLDDIMQSLMPEHADLIERVDTETAYRLLGDERLVDSYVGLLMDRAELKTYLAQSSTAKRLEKRAVKLFITNLKYSLRLSPQGHINGGRLSGLDLSSILEEEHSDYLEEIRRLIHKGIIPTA